MNLFSQLCLKMTKVPATFFRQEVPVNEDISSTGRGHSKEALVNKIKMEL